MAGEPTPTTADASAAAVDAPPAAESAAEVADAVMEAAEQLSASFSGEESANATATPMDVDEQPAAASDDAGSALAAKEESAEGESSKSDAVRGEGEGAAEVSDTTAKKAAEEGVGSGEDVPAAGTEEIAAADADRAVAATKEEDQSASVSGGANGTEAASGQKGSEKTQERAGAAPASTENVAGVKMTLVEGEDKTPEDKPEPVVEQANAESDCKPISESSEATKTFLEAASSNGDVAATSEQEQAPEVAGKRKEREPEQAPIGSDDQATPAEPAVNADESSAKKQKVEETPDQSGVTADGTETAAGTIAAPAIMISRDDMAKMEEDDGVLKFDVITNDGEPEHMVQLTTLKNIFAKQLPKMPKEYIVRLVFDRNHRSMIILKNGKHVIGGICYRPFQPNHFAEIAFCAINASDQVKGYGTRLMNHLKEYVKLQGITNFLTYADNYAIGYFKKQGFSKVVSMPRPNWFGYIKDYDGGTLMECTIHHQINYLRITSMVHKQRQAILEKIKQNSKAHIVYSGLTAFAEGRLLDIYMIPGVKEAGWSQATIRNNRIGTRDPGSLKTQLTQLWKAVSSHRSAWPFHEPVDTNVVVDYLDYIKEPIDLTTIGKRVEAGAYVSKAQFKADLDKMCSNCTVYNLPDTNYYKAAVDLQEFISKRVQVRDQPR